MAHKIQRLLPHRTVPTKQTLHFVEFRFVVRFPQLFQTISPSFVPLLGHPGIELRPRGRLNGPVIVRLPEADSLRHYRY